MTAGNLLTDISAPGAAFNSPEIVTDIFSFCVTLYMRHQVCVEKESGNYQL